ncbi:MAG: lipocalin family protein [Paramuribaculum sp.]|nr:lipocalin family protein [Paramuribaculum sp.]
MKKYLIMLFVAILPAIAFTSCSDDDDVAITEANLIGKWNAVRGTGWEKEDGVIVDQWNEKVSGITLEFNTDGTCSFDEDGDIVSGDWTIDGNELFISFFDDGEEILIKQLTSNTLVISYYYKDDRPWHDYVTEEYIEFSFQRI